MLTGDPKETRRALRAQITDLIEEERAVQRSISALVIADAPSPVELARLRHLRREIRDSIEEGQWALSLVEYDARDR